MEPKPSDVQVWMLKNKREEGILYYLGFLLWPFGAMIASMRYYDKPWAKNIFWLFCVFFGFTFIVGEDVGDSADSIRYAQLLVEYAQTKMTFPELSRSFYNESAGFTDIAQPLITYIVSRFTRNPTILFAVFGLIFGYFYSRNLSYIMNQVRGKINFIVALFIMTFALINPIWNINGFRMWAAGQIFIFGTLPYIIEGNKKRLIWSFISVFFHFSFLFAIAILGLYLLVKNRPTIFLVFFILTSFIRELDLSQVQSVLSFLPDVFQTKVYSYTNQDYADLISTSSRYFNWYIPYSLRGLTWTCYAIILVFYFVCRKHYLQNKMIMSLFSFCILFYSASNIFSLVPSGDRFLVIANCFMFAFFVLVASMIKIKSLLFVNFLSLPLLILFCIVSIRIGMDYFGLVTIVGNPVFALLDTGSYPFITDIKKLILINR